MAKTRKNRKGGKTSAKKGSLGKSGGKKSVSLAVKSYVKRAIHTNVENKKAVYNASFTFGSISNSATLYARPLTPATTFLTINQGLGQGDRIGNKCRTMRAMFRYTLFPLPYDLGVNPQPTPVEVMIIFGYVKASPTTVPTAGQVQLLFQSGNTSLPPQGDLGDLIQPFNTDVWTIKKVIRHKIGNSVVEGSGAQPARANLANNDFKFNAVRAVNITKIYPKSLVFNDTNNTINNAGLYVMIQAVNANGGVMPFTTVSTFADYALDLTYEDA